MNEGSNHNSSWCERLYDANARQLLLYGRALGLSHAEAEDVLQETFVALLRRDSPPEQPAHYCIRSFRNRAFNYRRSLWRRVLRELESARWFERSDTETPQERAAMRQLAALPVEQREVIVLKIWGPVHLRGDWRLAGNLTQHCGGAISLRPAETQNLAEKETTMNDWNPLEHPFRSWKPRSPSRKLKARLFPEVEARR